jgi:hypothetical protein
MTSASIRSSPSLSSPSNLQQLSDHLTHKLSIALVFRCLAPGAPSTTSAAGGEGANAPVVVVISAAGGCRGRSCARAAQSSACSSGVRSWGEDPAASASGRGQVCWRSYLDCQLPSRAEGKRTGLCHRWTTWRQKMAGGCFRFGKKEGTLGGFSEIRGDKEGA